MWTPCSKSGHSVKCAEPPKTMPQKHLKYLYKGENRDEVLIWGTYQGTELLFGISCWIKYKTWPSLRSSGKMWFSLLSPCFNATQTASSLFSQFTPNYLAMKKSMLLMHADPPPPLPPGTVQSQILTETMDYKALQSIFFCGRMKEGERIRETGKGRGRSLEARKQE